VSQSDPDIDFGNPEDTVEEAQDTSFPSFPSLDVRSGFAARVDDDDSDNDNDDGDTNDDGEIPLEDPEEPMDSDVVDWETREVELASMDMSGQSYAVYAAEVSVSLYFAHHDL
jgi:hypothetical protein